MKKYILVLAALSIAAISCNKEEMPETNNDAKLVNINLKISLDQKLTRCNFDLADASDITKGINVTWKTGDHLTLIVFQGANADWKTSGYVYKSITLPAAANGLNTYDVSSLFGALDLTGFDSGQNLKYVVVLSTGSFAWNNSDKRFQIFNGAQYINHDASITEQINTMGMIAETNVQEIAFPGSSTLDLEGKLHWITSVLAVQFNIEPEADITMPAGSKLNLLLLSGSGSTFVDCYTPITKERKSIYYNHICPIAFETEAKISDALDANNCRYFTIPADGMINDADQKLAGATLNFRKSKDGQTYYDTTGSIGTSVVIEGGKVYGIRVHVTDSNSDGNPEFTKY